MSQIVPMHTLKQSLCISVDYWPFNSEYIYSGYGEYSDSFKMFTLCFIAAVC